MTCKEPTGALPQQSFSNRGLENLLRCEISRRADNTAARAGGLFVYKTSHFNACKLLRAT